MTALYVSSFRPDGRLFFYHTPTATLAELLLNASPGGNHVLRVASSAPVPDAAFTAIAEYLRRTYPLADDHLAMFSRGDIATNLPESIVLVHASEEKALIHYPTLGFTAGIHGDGRKIPPHWQNPAAFTPTQRSQLLAKAADELMRSIADHGN